MIETERLRLRPWKSGDLQPFATMNADARVRRFFPCPLSPEESDASVATYRRMHELDGYGFFAAELRATSKFIGVLGMQRMSFELAHVSKPAIEIGWRLEPEVWGQGLATEGARGVLQFAFRQIQLAEVVAITVPVNLPSRRVMEKLGMTHDAQDDFDHPKIADAHPLQRHVLYRIRRQAWLDRDASAVS